MRDYAVTSANVHDSKVALKLLERSTKEGEPAWEDARHVGTEEGLREGGIVPIVCEKGYKGHPLTEIQKANNRMKPSTRSRVEHVFRFMEQSVVGLVFRGVGMARAKANIAMTNLAYNMCRLAHTKAYHAELDCCEIINNQYNYPPKKNKKNYWLGIKNKYVILHRQWLRETGAGNKITHSQEGLAEFCPP